MAPFVYVFLGNVVFAYENLVINPSSIITLLGCRSAAVGLVWLIVSMVH